ncbi:hypothetical protein EST38_g1247 [Candolleomyces aberdarensis]|uniref:Uncharacterized protein n=1 Tax=Candolleomyces aberdarensis TaxID=2316362 RepID=A0A4Q2DZX5_9AGAR|nr:hypothetical protein EST38_g1247 [Candolleomyces aberdarensis]
MTSSLSPQNKTLPLTLTAGGFMLSVASSHGQSFNERHTEDCSYGPWNMFHFILCGTKVGRLLPTPQLRVWAKLEFETIVEGDPNISAVTHAFAANKIEEMIPDFAIAFHKPAGPPPGYATVQDFLESITFGSMPSWDSCPIARSYLPLISEVKRSPTRHPTNIKQYGYSLIRFLDLAQRQAELQAVCLFQSQIYRHQPEVYIIASSAEYWTFKMESRNRAVMERGEIGIMVEYNAITIEERELEESLEIDDGTVDDSDDGISFFGEDSMEASYGDEYSTYQSAGDYDDILSDDGVSNPSSHQSTHNSSLTMVEDNHRQLHDQFVNGKGKQQVYNTEDLNQWWDLYSFSQKNSSSISSGGQHATKFDRHLDLCQWSPIFKIGTEASLAAMTFIQQKLHYYLADQTADEREPTATLHHIGTN